MSDHRITPPPVEPSLSRPGLEPIYREMERQTRLLVAIRDAVWIVAIVMLLPLLAMLGLCALLVLGSSL